MSEEAFERSDMGYKVAVVGATGNVGREILNVLAERKFPIRNLKLLASARSAGSAVSRYTRSAAR